MSSRMKQDSRFYGLMVVLVLVTLAMIFFQKAGQAPYTRPDLENVPELGKVPTQEQIENRPPKDR